MGNLSIKNFFGEKAALACVSSFRKVMKEWQGNQQTKFLLS